MTKGTTTRSPFLSFVTELPTSTTMPIGSCPSTSPFFHSHHKSIVKMEVRSADRGRGDLDNRVCWFLNLRIGNRINADVVFAVPAFDCVQVRRSASEIRSLRFLCGDALFSGSYIYC